MSALFRAFFLSAVSAVVLPALAEAAASPYSPSNYVFPNGAKGFALETSGGLVNPGVLVGFNPQPDPPANSPILDLSTLTEALVVEGDGSVFRFQLSFLGLRNFVGPRTIGSPNSDGFTEFEFAGDGSVFVADLGFSGPGGVVSWVAFDPQPDPPGDFFAYEVGFEGDATVSLRLTENGVPLSFSPSAVPEPSTWILMGVGFAAFGVLARRRAVRTSAI